MKPNNLQFQFCPLEAGSKAEPVPAHSHLKILKIVSFYMTAELNCACLSKYHHFWLKIKAWQQLRLTQRDSTIRMTLFCYKLLSSL